MLKTLKVAAFAAIMMATLTVAAAAQSTTGTVNMSATASKFVEINSAGAVSLTGNSGGGVTTDGTLNNPLAVVINLGEIGPSNLNPFVVASVPLKIRSNATYQITATAVVTSSATSGNRLLAADVGFGLGAVSRVGVGVNSVGSDTNGTNGDPTAAGAGTVNLSTGRFEYSSANGSLGGFTSVGPVLSGPQIMNAVPRANSAGLTVPAIFAIKPQFYENGSSTIAVTFTATTP
jgi:hypothetical protein